MAAQSALPASAPTGPPTMVPIAAPANAPAAAPAAMPTGCQPAGPFNALEPERVSSLLSGSCFIKTSPFLNAA